MACLCWFMVDSDYRHYVIIGFGKFGLCFLLYLACMCSFNDNLDVTLRHLTCQSCGRTLLESVMHNCIIFRTVLIFGLKVGNAAKLFVRIFSGFTYLDSVDVTL